MIISSLIAGIPIMKNALAAIRYRIVSIDALVSIAVIGALIIGEYFEAAAVTFLFMLGGFFWNRKRLIRLEIQSKRYLIHPP